MLRAEPLAAQLQAQITETGLELGGPHFEPHVTLLGGVRGREAEVVQTAALLAAELAVRRAPHFRAPFKDPQYPKP